ncbi:outer membrane biogenesis protein BamB [Novipirellula aureliae]|uniref:Outer membrane biogenesis protein BamB n=1 Tax=Novipirellula aureliae TaxID=2527966 RepID=A0A5C6DH23_9BACT|nr:PQQ-binding-like beta-propeller repeat protein [Novipirellula aureliae]TWU36603.1 outer membrane biogenesis protein BamB [Novipirellula aureliae]
MLLLASRFTNRLLICTLTAIGLTAAPQASAEDWPGWMGTNRDGVYTENGIIEQIPSGGLPVKWRKPIEGGYAGPAVAGGRVFVFDYDRKAGDIVNDPGQRAALQGSERVLAFDQETGELLWKYEYDCPYKISYPAGPRCTPTVEGDRVYLLGSEGDLTCLNTASGERVWSRSFKKDFDAEVPIWGFSGHPLIDGDVLYCQVGGKGQGVVAFDKMSGDVRWKSLDAKVGYAPPSMIEFGGVKQLLIYHPTAVEGLDPTNGKSYWQVPIEPSFDMSISRPMVEGDLMYASGIRTVSVLVKLSSEKPEVKELWRGKRDVSVFTCNSTPIIKDGIIFGTDCNVGSLMAVDTKDGSRLWETFAATKPDEKRFVNHGTAFLTRIAGTDRYFIMSENGDLILANLSKDAYSERGRFSVVKPTSEAFGRSVVWSHPAYANRTAYIRNDEEIVAVDIAQ